MLTNYSEVVEDCSAVSRKKPSRSHLLLSTEIDMFYDDQRRVCEHEQPPTSQRKPAHHGR